MKKVLLIPIIIGSFLLTAGITALVFGLSTARGNKAITNEYKVEAYNDIKIDISVADLEFKVSEDGQRKVVCEEREKQYHTVEVAGNTLNIKSFDTRKWNERIFNFNFKPLRVTIYAPSETYNNANIISSTGDVTIPNDFSFNDLKIKLSTGEIDINTNCNKAMNLEVSTGDINVETKTKNLNVTASTGDISIKNTEIEEKISLETSTGKINLVDVKAQNIDLISHTGNIKLDNTSALKHININGHTGDINLIDSDADTLDIETTTGDVKGTLLTTKIFNAHSSTGKVDVPDTAAGGICKIKTTTGDIVIKIKNL